MNVDCPLKFHALKVGVPELCMISAIRGYKLSTQISVFGVRIAGMIGSEGAIRVELQII